MSIINQFFVDFLAVSVGPHDAWCARNHV